MTLSKKLGASSSQVMTPAQVLGKENGVQTLVSSSLLYKLCLERQLAGNHIRKSIVAHKHTVC